jgi:hypothetical protein
MLKETLNHDVAGIVRRQVRFVKEALKSQSANTFHVMEYDIARLEAYLSACDAYKSHVVGEPQIDCPETHPSKVGLELPEIGSVDSIENESISDWARLVLISAYELMDSQSSRMASGLISHDSTRYDLLSAKLKSLVENYIKTQLPLDTPESVPSVESVSNGNQGV